VKGQGKGKPGLTDVCGFLGGGPSPLGSSSSSADSLVLLLEDRSGLGRIGKESVAVPAMGTFDPARLRGW
jgi:hypothetical protein